MRKVMVTCVSALVSLAVLVPAGSAHAAFREDPFCSPDADFWHRPVTLVPGQMCTSWPLNVNEFKVWWEVVKPGRGQVCLALTQYGGSGSGQPISGIPGWRCVGVGYGGNTTAANAEEWWFSRWTIYAYNPYLRYSYRYGQARILNLSSATIRMPGESSLGNWVTHWVP
jgi:hypothetical protein